MTAQTVGASMVRRWEAAEDGALLRELRRFADLPERAPSEARLALLEPFLKICDTVRYAHDQVVIHRDLKPENGVLVRPTAPVHGWECNRF